MYYEFLNFEIYSGILGLEHFNIFFIKAVGKLNDKNVIFYSTFIVVIVYTSNGVKDLPKTIVLKYLLYSHVYIIFVLHS